MRRLGAAVAVVGLLASAAILVRPAAGSDEALAEGTLVNDETVVSSLDPTGLPIESDIISRLASNGGELRTVLDPTSTANIEYLNQRGQPTVTADGIEVEVGGPEPKVILTKALVSKPLPLAMHAEYSLDGQIVDPLDVVGADGTVRIRYTVTNTDVKRQKVTYSDAKGRTYTKRLPVFAPLVGTLTTTVPQSWEISKNRNATVTTDGEGNSILSWDLVLYPPLGDFSQTLSFTATADEGSVPQTVLTAAPAGTAQNPAADFSAELLEQSADGTEELAAGLEQLDNQTLSLAQGAAELSSGIAGLAGGTKQISDGFSSQVAPGAAGLAEGAAGVAEGVTGLAAGAAQLADGQRQFGAGIGEAAQGADGLYRATDELAAGLKRLADGVTGLSDGLDGLDDGTAALLSGAELLADAVGSPGDPPLPTPTPSIPQPPTPIPTPGGTPSFAPPSPVPSPTQTPTLEQAVQASVNGAQQLRDELVTLNNNLLQISGLLQQADSALCTTPAAAGCAELQQAAGQLATEVQRAYGLAYGGQALLVGLTQIQVGVDLLSRGLRSGSDQPGAEGLVEGLEELSSGLAATADGAEQLVVGADQASGGAEQLADGTQGLADGLGDAADGADQLESSTGLFADGAGQLAEGSRQLAVGADQFAFGTVEVAVALAALSEGTAATADGGAQLASGAAQLQSRGTRELYESVAGSSAESAQATAYLQAADDRAATALPYGAPEGAQGNAAYIMTMEEVTPGDSSGWQFAAIAILLLAAVAGAVLKQLQS